MADKPGVQDPTPVAASPAAKAVESAPDESNKASKKVQTVWPTDHFVVEGMPVVTREGVQLTAKQFDEVQKLAKASGVKVREVTD